MQRAVEGSCRATYPLHCRADLVVGYLHHHESPVHSGKMHFPTVGKFMAHGQWRSDVPDKAYALRSPFLSSLRSQCTSFYSPFTRAGPNNFYSLFGRTRCTIRRDVSILERTAPDWRPEANLQGSLSVIISDESSEMNAFDERRLPFKSMFYDSRNPFNVIFPRQETRRKFFVFGNQHCVLYTIFLRDFTNV